MNAIMDVSVPISGVYPSFGPTIETPVSFAADALENIVVPEKLAVSAAVAFKKNLRVGWHSAGNMAASSSRIRSSRMRA
jgi:hypothetical protein